jgi:hypothetical protein
VTADGLINTLSEIWNAATRADVMSDIRTPLFAKYWKDIYDRLPTESSGSFPVRSDLVLLSRRAVVESQNNRVMLLRLVKADVWDGVATRRRRNVHSLRASATALWSKSPEDIDLLMPPADHHSHWAGHV